MDHLHITAAGGSPSDAPIFHEGGVRADTLVRSSMATRSRVVADDFSSYEDGEVLHGKATPVGGAPWSIGTLTGNTNAVTISRGRAEASELVYATLDSGQQVSRVDCTFSVLREGAHIDSATGGVTIALSTLDRGVTIRKMLHLVVREARWELTAYVNPDDVDNIDPAPTWMASVDHTLTFDGSPMRVAMEVDWVNGVVWVYGPAGDRTRVPAVGTQPTGWGTAAANTALIKSLAGCRAGFWETMTTTTGKHNYVHDFSLGPVVAEGLVAKGGAAMKGDVEFFRGTGFTRQSKINGGKGATLSGAGWYRIATDVLAYSYAMGGRVRLSCVDAGHVQGWEFDVYSGAWGTPSLVHRHGVAFGLGLAIDQVRCSYDATATPNKIVLDIHVVSTETAISLNCDMVGYFAPVDFPVVGATALTGGSATLNAAAP